MSLLLLLTTQLSNIVQQLDSGGERKTLRLQCFLFSCLNPHFHIIETRSLVYVGESYKCNWFLHFILLGFTARAPGDKSHITMHHWISQPTQHMCECIFFRFNNSVQSHDFSFIHKKRAVIETFKQYVVNEWKKSWKFVCAQGKRCCYIIRCT